MNVYAPRETDYQRRLVEEGRRAFVAQRMAIDSAYRAGQSYQFTIGFLRAIVIDNVDVDVFLIAGAEAALPPVWHREAEARGYPIETTGTRGHYHVLVPRRSYWSGRAPFAVDGALVRDVALALAGAAVFGLGAAVLGGGAAS